MLDPEAVKNSIVCRNDGVCWAVDGNAVRHHISTYGDNVCWRWVNGWRVSRNNVSSEQASSLREEGAWGCSMNRQDHRHQRRPGVLHGRRHPSLDPGRVRLRVPATRSVGDPKDVAV